MLQRRQLQEPRSILYVEVILIRIEDRSILILLQREPEQFTMHLAKRHHKGKTLAVCLWKNGAFQEDNVFRITKSAGLKNARWTFREYAKLTLVMSLSPLARDKPKLKYSGSSIESGYSLTDKRSNSTSHSFQVKPSLRNGG